MRAIATAGILATLFTAIAYALCGPTLGVLLCGLFAAGLLIALLDDPSRPTAHRAFHAAAILDSVALVWIVSVLFSPVTFLQWLQAYVVLISVGASVLSMRLIGADGRIAAFTWMAWFAAPVTLAHAMLGSHGVTIASAITRFHPLFALNRIVIDQGAWTSGDIAYRLLTPLGQDVAYALPGSVLPCVIGHLIVTGVCLFCWRFWARPVATARC